MPHLSLNHLVAACALTVTLQAHADSAKFIDFAHGSESVNFKVTASDLSTVLTQGATSAGGFLMSYNSGPTFESYCVDLFQHIAFGDTYTDYGTPGTTHVFANNRAYTDLGRLYATAGVVNNAVEEAAFQIAAWEIAYETQPGAYNLSSGVATFLGGSADSSGALALASTWLGNLTNGGHPDVLVIESDGHQDMIYAAVPEPQTYAMFMAGLAAMTFVARRRRA
jgi:PEP-CTERM motif